MSKSGCSAKLRKREEQQYRLSSNPTSPIITCHQNIGGVIVPPVLTCRDLGTRTPNHNPKKDLSDKPIACDYYLKSQQRRSHSPGVTIRSNPVVELSDQIVGISVTDTAVGLDRSATSSNTLPRTATGENTFQMSDPATAMHNPSVSHSGGQKMYFSQSGILHALYMVRDPVVDYQESRGVPRNEEVTFLTLVTSLCTQAYTAAITILVMLWNLMPLVDGLVYFIRFFLDKLIDIVKTEDNKDKAIKSAILFGEMTIITFIIFLIFGLIFMPVYVLIHRLCGKIFSMIVW